MIFDHIVRTVAALEPGQCIVVSSSIMMELRAIGFKYKGARFKPEDRVLEQIPGSAYEWRYRELIGGDGPTGSIVFERLKKPVEHPFRAYVSPDRRDAFTFLPLAGLWQYHGEK